MVTFANVSDGSGSITEGGTDQELFDANPNRTGLLIQNHSDGDLWINYKGGAAEAKAPSLKLEAGGTYVADPFMVFGGAIRIYGATTGQEFLAEEYV